MKTPLPRLEYEILLCHCFRIKRIDLIAHPEKYDLEDHRFLKLVDRRSKGEPVAYITGIQPFCGLDFFVDRNVLIPRPETELLVELALKKAPGSIADVGTGSGAIAVTLARHLPNAKVIGIDSAPEAIKIAERNAEYHKVEDRCQFVEGNLLEPLKDKVDLIVSNPPYIPSADIETLQSEVRDFEPRAALDGGEDGLKYIRQIIREAPRRLKSEGLLMLEFGFGQAPAVRELTKESFKSVSIFRDYSNLERYLVAH